jgi:hypothetical protein
MVVTPVKWIVVFDSHGPGRVGPFDSAEQAGAWAGWYTDLDAARGGSSILRWDLEILAEPSEAIAAAGS